MYSNNKIILPVVVVFLAVYYYFILTTSIQPSSLFDWYGGSPTTPQNPEYDPMKEGHPKLASNSYLDVRAPKRNRTQIGRENATMVMLARNLDLKGALESMRSLEDRFNRNYRYPWVFMNEVPFDQEFIEQTTLMASGETFYELIPEEDWEPPSFISEEKLQQNLKESVKNNIIYGGYRSYRNMCHFNSGFFYKQKRLDNYDWYFRVEPDVQYMCDFQYDPFTVLRKKDKIYGFVIAIIEYENTIPTLWQTVEKFMEEYPELVHANNSLAFATTNESSLNLGAPMIETKTDYNLCHFWSNFEIANLNFFRSEAYNTFFNYLDKTGGFYYERWGDAPVHSIALNVLADKNKIHHFEDIGYFHAPYLACPSLIDVLTSKRCVCKARDGDQLISKPIDVNHYSCLSRWWRYGAGKTFLNDIDYEWNS
ncbi:glycosyltransferase family 15 protein [Suhomyces tanzawaensis NRRL Y-17324]|uniref:Glycosyltransferase family 15 protein n=1 Tax=Suhomyces tanzawaensis NRRL Y-17324 TaxID=984487 RepID=A0A1E4SK00_9ASCO|nr:glycosyltransferase family 15 protein [Suhomyces tanzawaensis NRRL Y-17324]ODV79818.1 glycosyltransferase family 15 protein [Suhomyces tanzawaensis NRRL Y-17324]